MAALPASTLPSHGAPLQNVLTVGATIQYPRNVPSGVLNNLYLLRYRDGNGNRQDLAVSVCLQAFGISSGWQITLKST